MNLFAYGVFYGQDGYRHGPYLAHADTAEGAVRFAVRELVSQDKLNKDAGYAGKAVYCLVKESWLTEGGKGIYGKSTLPYGKGFLFKYDKKKDKINLTEV